MTAPAISAPAPKGRLGNGQLRRQVAEWLAARPGPHTVGEIAKDLGQRPPPGRQDHRPGPAPVRADRAHHRRQPLAAAQPVPGRPGHPARRPDRRSAPAALRPVRLTPGPARRRRHRAARPRYEPSRPLGSGSAADAAFRTCSGLEALPAALVVGPGYGGGHRLTSGPVAARRQRRARRPALPRL